MGNEPRKPSVGKTIARLRVERGWSLEDLESKSGVPKSTIHYLESGRQRGTRVENLMGLAHAFGVTLDALCDGADESPRRFAS